MAINAVVTGIESTADKPFPEGRMASVQRDVPILVPVEEIRVFLKALRKPIEAKAVEDSRVLQVGLSDKCLRWANVVLFLPVDRNLSLRHFRSSILRHAVPPGLWRRYMLSRLRVKNMRGLFGPALQTVD